MSKINEWMQSEFHLQTEEVGQCAIKKKEWEEDRIERVQERGKGEGTNLPAIIK